MNKPQPIPNNTRLDDFRPTRFLKPADLLNRWKVQQLAVTISHITEEETTPNPKDLDPDTADAKNQKGKPRIVMQKVLYFKAKNGEVFPRGYLLSANVDIESLAAATGAETAGELIGKRIIIHVSEHRKNAVLRISPTPPESMSSEPPKPPTQLTSTQTAMPDPKKTGEVIEATCKKCGMLAQVNPETQRFYTHQNVAGEACNG